MNTTQTSSSKLYGGEIYSCRFTVTSGAKIWFVKVLTRRSTNTISQLSIHREGGSRRTPHLSKVARRIMAAIRADVESTWSALDALGF